MSDAPIPSDAPAPPVSKYYSPAGLVALRRWYHVGQFVNKLWCWGWLIYPVLLPFCNSIMFGPGATLFLLFAIHLMLSIPMILIYFFVRCALLFFYFARYSLRGLMLVILVSGLCISVLLVGGDALKVISFYIFCSFFTYLFVWVHDFDPPAEIVLKSKRAAEVITTEK